MTTNRKINHILHANIVRNLNAAIKDKNVTKLVEWLEPAEMMKVSMGLRFRGWRVIADSLFEQERWIESLVAYNKARKCKPTDRKTLARVFNCVQLFFDKHRSEFTQDDLIRLHGQVSRLIELSKVYGLWFSSSVREGLQLAKRIRVAVGSAPDEIEGRATAKVDTIVAALSMDVTKAEVAADFAKVLGPVFREILAQEVQPEKGKKRKAHAGIKKSSARRRGNK